jgi:diamine N-acetyltransferase
MSPPQYGNIRLRPIDDHDIELLMIWENNPEFWHVSDRTGPYTREQIAAFIEDCRDLRHSGQLRWMIVDHEGEPLGALDIFDYDPKSNTAGLGILIALAEDRKKGYAGDALKALLQFYKKEKSIRSFRSLVYYDNVPSLRLFRKCGFKELGRIAFKGKPAVQFYISLP